MNQKGSNFDNFIIKGSFGLERVNGRESGETARSHRLARTWSLISDICCRCFFHILKNVWVEDWTLQNLEAYGITKKGEALFLWSEKMFALKICLNSLSSCNLAYMSPRRK